MIFLKTSPLPVCNFIIGKSFLMKFVIKAIFFMHFITFSGKNLRAIVFYLFFVKSYWPYINVTIGSNYGNILVSSLKTKPLNLKKQ